MGKYKAPTIRNALPSTLPLLLSLSSSLPLFLFSSPSRATSPSPDERSSQENPHRCTVQTNKNRFDRVHKHGGRPAHLIARARFHGLLHDARSPCIRYLYWRKCALNIQFARVINRREYPSHDIRRVLRYFNHRASGSKKSKQMERENNLYRN